VQTQYKVDSHKGVNMNSEIPDRNVLLITNLWNTVI